MKLGYKSTKIILITWFGSNFYVWYEMLNNDIIKL